jgi:O-antigen/teichoic acid export membrane protein
MSSLTRSALSGAAWNYSGAAVLVVTQIASTAATARLVSAKEFGAYATAQAAIGIFSYFTLTAIGQDILRRPELGSKTVGTGTNMSIANGTCVAVVMWLVAGPWSDAWHVPSAAPLVRVFALTLLLVSCSTVPLALLRRALRFGPAAAVETGTQVIGITVGVLLAIHMHSAMALAIGQTIAAGTLLVAAVTLTRRELRFDFAISEVRVLFSFAGRVSALNVGFYSLYTAPAWLIARMFGAHTLGLYSRANVIVGLPLNYLTTGLTKVMYPLYGRVGSNIDRMRALLSEATAVATGFAWPLLALVAGAAPIIVELLLGPNWAGAAVLLQLCVLIACGNLPWVMLTNAAESFGWMRLVWVRQVAYLIVFSASVAVVHFSTLGVQELLLGVAAAQWIAYGLTAVAFTQRGYLDPRMTASSQVIHGAVAFLAYVSAALCAHILRNTALAAQVIAEVAVGLGVFGGVVVGRFWYPATRLLGNRLASAAPGNSSRMLVRLGFILPH